MAREARCSIAIRGVSISTDAPAAGRRPIHNDDSMRPARIINCVVSSGVSQPSQHPPTPGAPKMVAALSRGRRPSRILRWKKTGILVHGGLADRSGRETRQIHRGRDAGSVNPKSAAQAAAA